MISEVSPDFAPEAPPPSRPGFLGRLLRGLFRLLLTILVGALLGAAIYFGARSFYRQAVLLPAQESVARMEDLSAQQARQATRAAAEIEKLNTRLNELEKSRKGDSENISSLQAEITTLDNQLEESLTALGRLKNMEDHISAIATRSMKNSQDIDTLLSSSAGPVAGLKREVQMLRSMELLNRCRLYLSQNNYGLAEQDARLVRQIFVDLRAESAPADQAALDVWIARLDLAITNLRIAPVLAGEDLEMVWRMLLAGLPPQNQSLTPLPGDATPTPTGTPWVTPTLTPYAPPTATPWVTPTPAAT